MAGGLIQLVTTGIQDSPIIGNPEITFFKTVYRQHTMFSLCQNDRFIGKLEFGKEGTKVVEKNGDLLYNQTFKLEIPYFEIIKTQNIKEILKYEHDINELNITYMNTNCVVVNIGGGWYIIPERLFKIGNFDKITSDIESSKLENNFLPEFIKSSDLGSNVTLYNINESPSSPIISMLRVESNYWEQFWLDFVDKTTDESYYNALQTLTSTFKRLYQNIRSRIFTNYYTFSSYYKYSSLLFVTAPSTETDDTGAFIIKTETERYFEYQNNFDIAIKSSGTFEIDVIYKYCLDNNLIFNDYSSDYLEFTPLVFLLMYKMIYADNNILFTFWKKFSVLKDNQIDYTDTINETNFVNEWKQMLNLIQNETLKTNNIANIVLLEFSKYYTKCEKNISSLFKSINFQDYKTLYSKLNIFLQRFSSIPQYCVNFSSEYLPYKHDVYSKYQNDDYMYKLINELDKYSTLITEESNSLNDVNNLVPVNLEMTFAVFAEDLLRIISKSNLLNKSNISFIALWKNCIVDLIYKNFININNTVKQNTSLRNSDSSLKLSYYYSLNPSNMINSKQIKNMWYEMFYKSSWLGIMSIGNNNFLKLKENIYKTNKNLLTDISDNQNCDFHTLGITNKYVYTYYTDTNMEITDNFGKKIIKDIFYNQTTNKLYVRYDNFYDENLVTITITSTSTISSYTFSQIAYENVLISNSKNCMYLSFLLTTTFASKNNDTITLTVTYSNNIPLVNFYENNMVNPQITSTKYKILEKTSENQNKFLKIVNNELVIENGTNLVNSSKLKVLTINNLNLLYIVPPTYFNVTTSSQSIEDDKYLNIGTYGYAISYYTISGESDVTSINYVNVTTIANKKSYVMVSEIPISGNKSVIGRKIYRTKANSTDLFLLIIINNNTDISYIDKINDINLGIEYINNNDIKINTLPQSDTIVSKQIVKIVLNTTSKNYMLKTLNNTSITLPTTYSNINEIYLEEFNFPFSIITNFTINRIGTVKLTNSSDFSPDYLYYLGLSTNLADTTKLIPSKKTAYYGSSIQSRLIVGTSSFTIGTYNYRISFYNSLNGEESLPIDLLVTMDATGTKYIQIYDLPPITDSIYNSWRIYRKKSDNLYYLVNTTDDDKYNVFDDTYSDCMLTVLYEEPIFYITKSINTQTINRPDYFLINNSTTAKPSEFVSGVYKYEITYYGAPVTVNTVTTVEETIASTYKLFEITDYLPQLNFLTPIDPKIIGWNIYRSDIIPTDTDPTSIATKYVGTVAMSVVNKIFIDLLTTQTNVSPPTTNINNGVYNIIKVPFANTVPNLNNFISHSTDNDFINDKKLSDLSDYVFNKPMIMLVNNSLENSFSSEFDSLKCLNTPLLYFYNINFKINSTSTITLNGSTISYVIPIATQQFFIKPESEQYYKINAITQLIDNSTNLVTQKSFNPAFDEFNLPRDFIKTDYYYTDLIDKLCFMYDNFLNNSPDYSSVFSLIDNTIIEYKNIFQYMLTLTGKSYAGVISKRAVDLINGYNKFFDVFKLKIYTINLGTIIRDFDYIKYSRHGIRTIKSNNAYELMFKDITTLSSSNLATIKILSPIYFKFKSSQRLSNDGKNNLINLSQFHMNHVKYVNANSDFLTLMNPNNNKNDFLSISEIKKEINDNYYDYSGQTTIKTLFPIVDSAIDKLYVTDSYANTNEITSYTSTSISSTTTPYEINTSQYTDHKEQDNYDGKEVLTNISNNFTTKKFNYMGVVFINDLKEIDFTDTYSYIPPINPTSTTTKYIIFDDNMVYKGTNIVDTPRHTFISSLSDCLVVNPVELDITNIKTGTNSITITKLSSNVFIYEYSVVFVSSYINLPDGKYDLVIGLNKVNCVVKKNANDVIKLYIKSSSLITITDKFLIFMNGNVCTVTPQIKTITVSNFIETNYKLDIPVPDTLTTTNFNDVIIQIGGVGGEYFTLNNPFILNIDEFSTDKGIYINLNSSAASTSITQKIYFKSLNASAESSPTNSYITIKPIKSITINQKFIYTNALLNEYSTEIINCNDEFYFMFVDAQKTKHFIVKKKNIKTFEIPSGNYHLWILPVKKINVIPQNITYTINTNGNLSGLDGLQTGVQIDKNKMNNYCYYMVKGPNNEECFYYYENGTTISTNSLFIKYYSNITSSSAITKNEIFLVDNQLFNNNSQLIKSYKTRYCSENFVTQELNKESNNPFDFDSTNNIGFNSNFTTNTMDIITFNQNNCKYAGTYDVLVNLVLESKTTLNKIYLPVYLRKYENISFPKIKFTNGSINYESSIVPILTSGFTSTTLTGNITIGKIVSTYNISTLSTNLIITKDNLTNEYTIVIKSGYVIPNYSVGGSSTIPYVYIPLTLQLETTDGRTLIFYFWVAFVNITDIFNDFLTLATTGFSQPLNVDPNGNIKVTDILVNFDLKNENIFIKNSNDMILNVVKQNYNIGYKYYDTVRNIDITDNIHNVLPLNFNGVLNIKPKTSGFIYQTRTLAAYNTAATNQILLDAIYLIVIYVSNVTNKTVIAVEPNNPTSTLTTTATSRLTAYGSLSTVTNPKKTSYGGISLIVSYQNPLFVKNKIVLVQIDTTNFIISSYEKLYLEKNEIINIDSNFFVVKGLNIFSESYELESFTAISSSKIRYSNNGYYTYGVYVNKQEKEFDIPTPNNIITFNKTQSISQGEMYLTNNQLIISDINTTLTTTNGSLYGKFTEKSLNIKLFNNNNKFYLFDNFVKIKKFDKMIYVNKTSNIATTLTVVNIRNSEIIFDILLGLSENKFYDFILAYQPLGSIYVNIDLVGNIISDEVIEDEMTIGIQNSQYTNKIDLYSATDKKLNGWTKTAGNYWIYLLKTNYKKEFSNYMNIPKNNTLIIKNQHPICINVTYDTVNFRFKLNDPTFLVNGFTWFYGQPVKVYGIYSYIRNITAETTGSVTNYYIFIKDDISTLLSKLSSANLSTQMIISYSTPNMSSYYFYNKFRYNYGIQLLDYDMPDKTLIEVIRCVLKNDELVFITNKQNNKKIIFNYGVSIDENEKINGIIKNEYKNVYFYNYRMINSDGYINNFDTLIGTYFLIFERSSIASTQRIYLVQIKSGNRIKNYVEYNVPNTFSYNLSKLVGIKSHFNGEFTYINQQIVVSQVLADKNMNPIVILKKYQIKFKNIPIQENGKFKHEITFTSTTKVVQTDIYDTVYLDEKFTLPVNIIKTIVSPSENKHYLLYDKILSNDITLIYTKNTNFVLSSIQASKKFKDKNLNDDSLDFYINTQINNKEDYVQNMLLSKNNPDDFTYKVKLIDGTTTTLDIEAGITIDNVYSTVKSIDNNYNILTTEYSIDTDTLEQSNDFTKVLYYYGVNFDVSNIFDDLLLANSVKYLRLKLFEKCSVKLSAICSYLKPWNKWALLASSEYVPALKLLLNKKCYIKWNGSGGGGGVEVISNNVDVNYGDVISNGEKNYGDITKNETYVLSEFIKSVNGSAIKLQNYNTMKTDIEPLIIQLLGKLLLVPEFYLNVIDNINTILKSAGFDVYFDGNNIIFNNDKTPQYILVDGENEIPYYLSNEYVYNVTQNQVYRSVKSSTEISNQLFKWINKSEPIAINEILFGVSINKLLRYINIFGNQLKTLLDDFTDPLSDTPNYYYLNPIKFIVGKIWEKYCTTGNLVNLEKEFTDKLISTVNFTRNTTNNYDFLSLDYLFKIAYYGFLNYGAYRLVNYSVPFTDINILDITDYKPYTMIPVVQQNGLIINPVYKYKLNFTSGEILSNCTYFLDFLNGDKISTIIDIGNIQSYPDQLSFSSNYNIKPNDFYILNQQKTYNIVSSLFLGLLYKIKFDSVKYNVTLVDEVFLNGNNLVINSINGTANTIDLLIPESTTASITDVFEFRNYEFIKGYNISLNKIYIDFADTVFPFVSNQTIIVIDTQKYFLKIDNGKYYIDFVGFNSFNIYDVVIITQCTCQTATSLTEYLYQYQLDPPINDTDYRPINDNYIVPLEFSIINATQKIQPLHVHTYGDNKIVFHYTSSQSSKFTQIVHKKRIVENLSNEIVSLVKQDEFLYYVDVKYPLCTNTTGFVYYNIGNTVYDIEPLIGITEPKLNIQNKTSIYFSQIDAYTYFSIKTLYTDTQLINNVGFIHKNQWDILESNYTISNNTIIITMPVDFLLLLLTNKSYYKINTFPIQNTDISSYDNKLVIKWNPLNGVPTGTILFKQYFVESIGTVFKPLENRKYTATIEYPYQYLPTTNFYMYQYDGVGSKFDNYLYLLETTLANPGTDGYFQTIKPSTMQLIANNKVFIVKILDKVRVNNKTCYVISYSEKLDLTSQYTYHFNDFKMNIASSIKYYQNALQFAKFYSQTELNTISLFMNESVNNFSIVSDTTPIVNPSPTKFYLVSYEKSELTNLFYSTEFKQNINMNQKIEYTEQTVITNQIPTWGDYSNFFSLIKLYFNDQEVEELNENVFAIDKYLYSTDEKRNQRNKMCEVKFDGKKWTFYLPLVFWYSLKSGLSIPTVAMPNTEIRLKYLLNDISHVLQNDLLDSKNIKYSFTKTPAVNLTLVTDYVLLDNMERKLFGNNAHEYIIDRYKIYPDTYITSEESLVKCNFKGLIKDIHLISRPLSNKKLTYYPKIKTNYDAKYDDYIKGYTYYLDILTTGKYRTDEQRRYAVDIEIIRGNEVKLALYKISTNKLSSDFIQINRLTDWFNTWSTWNEDLLKYLMYYDVKYLSQITDNKRKEYILTTYLKYQYSNDYSIETISPIESLLFKANGSSLFAERDYTYFTDVVPYQKFKNSLPNGYYTYTFSLHPTEDQHSGHLNFSNFDDVVIKVKSNSLVNTDQYSLSTVVKEYNILRIMSGHSSLAWL